MYSPDVIIVLHSAPLFCVAREGLGIVLILTSRGFATLRTLAMIGVAPLGLLGMPRHSDVPLFGGSETSVTTTGIHFQTPYQFVTTYRTDWVVLFICDICHPIVLCRPY